MAAWREIEIEATPEEVWDALATEEGRERWLGEPEREIQVESEEPPHRLVWWWWRATRRPRGWSSWWSRPRPARACSSARPHRRLLARLAASLAAVPA